MNHLARDLTLVTLAGLSLGLAIQADVLGWLLLVVSAAALIAAGLYRLAARQARQRNLAYYRAYRDGRMAERRAAGLDANVDARWVG